MLHHHPVTAFASDDALVQLSIMHITVGRRRATPGMGRFQMAGEACLLAHVIVIEVPSMGAHDEDAIDMRVSTTPLIAFITATTRRPAPPRWQTFEQHATPPADIEAPAIEPRGRYRNGNHRGRQWLEAAAGKTASAPLDIYMRLIGIMSDIFISREIPLCAIQNEYRHHFSTPSC